MTTLQRRALSISAWLALGAANGICGPVVYDLTARNIFGLDTTGQHRVTDSYLTGPDGVGTGWAGTVSLLPINPIDERGTAGLPTNFFDILSLAFGTGWTYASAATPLTDGSIKIETYDALSNKSNGAGSGMCNPCVGAEIDVRYVPGVGDPTANMHWIQVILDNNSLTPPNEGPGNIENIVDTKSTQKSPYYEDGYAANSRNLLDLPSRFDYQSTTWLADLFLVSGPSLPVNGGPVTPGLITFYGGLEYGWTNSVPEPSTFVLFAAGTLLLFARRRARG